MCGIVGWVNLKKDIKPYYNIVEDMRDTLVFRGPNIHGIKYMIMQYLDIEG